MRSDCWRVSGTDARRNSSCRSGKRENDAASSTRLCRGGTGKGNWRHSPAEFRCGLPARVLAKNRPAFVLNVTEPAQRLSSALRSYIQEGEERHVSQRYKCRVRSPCYAVP